VGAERGARSSPVLLSSPGQLRITHHEPQIDRPTAPPTSLPTSGTVSMGAVPMGIPLTEGGGCGTELSSTNRADLYPHLEPPPSSSPMTPIGLAVIGAPELRAATDRWSDESKIGGGGFGTVYATRRLPTLAREGACAVKRLDADSMQGLDEFENEIRLLGTLHHANLVPLLGCCQEAGLICLVYPLMEGGDLECRLLRTELPPALARRWAGAEGEAVLLWRERLRIVRDASRGLCYLHSQATPVLHRDVKPSNILLDLRLNARLGDIGLAKQAPEMLHGRTHISSLTQMGTPGFIDPLISNMGHYSVETDAYAMGVTLAMCILGKPVQQTLMDADEMFEQPALAPRVVSSVAEWPDQTAIEVATIVKGLVVPRLRAHRLPLTQALRQLEDLADAAELRPGVSAPSEVRECVICMAELRAARFRCGHCVACLLCAELLVQLEAGCPACRVPAVIVERGAHLAAGATFIAPVR